MATTTTRSAPKIDLHDVHIVQRSSGFIAQGIQRERGEVLVTREWERGVDALVSRRYLAAPDYSLNETITECPCGRMWENEIRMAEHTCPARKD
jgi:hypothetical protein